MKNIIQRLREPVNGLTHFFACLVAAIATIVLLVMEGRSPTRGISLGIYGLSLTLLFGASAAYHMAPLGERGTALLRRLDHSAIYLLIAGTYTPFCVLAFSGFWRWGLLSVIWALAIIGIVVKMFVMQAPRWLSAGTYVVMGWLCLAAVGQMLQALPAPVLIWLTAGGLIYTLGAFVYITRMLDFAPGRFGFHEVWHILVILGAVAHFVAVAALATALHPGA